MQNSCCVFIQVSMCSHLCGVTQGVDSEDKLQSGFVFKILSLKNEEIGGRFREKDMWKVQGPEVVELMAKAGTGCLCCLQGSWSSLLEGQLEEQGMGRVGVSLAVQTPFMAETGELSRPAEPCTFLMLCPQNFLSSSSTQLGSPPETENEVWDLLVLMLVTSEQNVRRNQS